MLGDRRPLESLLSPVRAFIKCMFSFTYVLFATMNARDKVDDICKLFAICLQFHYSLRKKKRRVQFTAEFNSSLNKFLKYFIMFKCGTCIEQMFQSSFVCGQQLTSYSSSLVGTPLPHAPLSGNEN